MKYLVNISIFVMILYSCSGDENKKSVNSDNKITTPEVVKPKADSLGVTDGDITFLYKINDFVVAYTSDPDSLWEKQEWLNETYNQLNQTEYGTVILFDNHDHTPNLAYYGLNYPKEFNRFKVMAYWRIKDGQNKICYGGTKVDGTFYKCTYME